MAPVTLFSDNVTMPNLPNTTSHHSTFSTLDNNFHRHRSHKENCFIYRWWSLYTSILGTPGSCDIYVTQTPPAKAAYCFGVEVKALFSRYIKLKKYEANTDPDPLYNMVKTSRLAGRRGTSRENKYSVLPPHLTGFEITAASQGPVTGGDRAARGRNTT